MKETVLTKKMNLILDDTVSVYYNPKYVFIPIYDGDMLKVKDNIYVYKNNEIMTRSNGIKVCSPISGVVLGVRDMLYTNGKYPSVVVENDFKENTLFPSNIKKKLNEYDYDSFLRVLKETGISHNGKYTYEKLKNKDVLLLINGVEREPYFGCKYFLLKERVSDILETVDLISELLRSKKTIVAIKNINNDIISAFMNELGTYPNIELRLVTNEYPNGIDDYLKDVIGIKNATVIDIEEIINIYEALKKEESPYEKLITITGDALDHHSVYKVKKGTLLSEVFENRFNFTEKGVDAYLNGLMMGTKIDTLQYVIDDDMEGVFITKKKKKIETSCQNCGLCHKNCPRGLNPKYVCDHEGRVKAEYKETCLHCGLCDFVCPSNRTLSKYME